VIAYIDSSVLARTYLVDEDGHEQAVALIDDPEIAAVTGSWTRVEVSGALVRAARAGRPPRGPDVSRLLALLDGDLGLEGLVTVVAAPQEQVEAEALRIVRAHGLRAMDAWHLAVAKLTLPPLAEPGERMAFASRDGGQRAVAEQLGFTPL
jgi:predicted nucleic acid-binding protein